MFITDASINLMLDNQFVSGASNMMLSLHSAYSATGANLIGSKTAANFAAAATRTKNLAANCAISIPSASTVRWLGAWDSTGATFKGMQPNGGNDKTFQVDVTNNRILCEANGYAANATIAFYGGTPPTGLTEGTIYYVVGILAGDPDYFQVSATSGGAAIDITGQAAAGCVVSAVTEEVYSGTGTHTISTYSLSL